MQGKFVVRKTEKNHRFDKLNAADKTLKVLIDM